MEVNQLTEAELKEFFTLVERQERLEREMEELKAHVEKEIEKLRLNITDSHRKTYSKIEEVASRMNDYEREILDVKSKLEAFSSTVNERMLGIDTKVHSMEITLGSINAVMATMSESQKELIKVQNNTIRNLWKAFFAVLGVITTAAGIIFALIGLN